ncbi:MAG: hypothetical protein FJ104_04870, partial [Deltaproteobacteria bacterium]|nr:hypothetical protein [Deltaproteobacteria bacterium]
ALRARKLGPTAPLDAPALRAILALAEERLTAGRRDEVVAELLALVESERFRPFAELDDGRAARALLGDALARGTVEEPARQFLAPLLARRPLDVWGRRALRVLVELALGSDRPAPTLEILARARPSLPEELRGDVDHADGRAAANRGERTAALRALGGVGPRSRYRTEATYLVGLLEVEGGRLKVGEASFCKLADPKRTPREALAFAGPEFFEIRDLARPGLGRVAHEQRRYDDARYCYYLVPRESPHLAEALYESEATRYEARDGATRGAPPARRGRVGGGA